MMRTIDRLRERLGRDTLSFVARINVYGFGLMALWTVVNTTLLPTRVEATAPDGLAGSALGLVGFIGTGLAMIVQPLAGRVSDAWPGPDPRRPFIIAGTLLVIPGLLLFGVAGVFGVLLIGYMLMQLATNIAQAAYQAYIPDLVDDDARGIAAGAKNVLSVLGAALGLAGAHLLFTLDAPDGWVVGYVGAVVVTGGILTLLWVPRIPSRAAGNWGGVPEALDLRRVWREVTDTLRRHEVFRLGVIAQFLFMLGVYPAQRFLLLYLRDRFGAGAIGWASIGGAVAVLLAMAAAAGAGALSDVMGRSRVLLGSVIVATAGLALIGLAPSLMVAAVAGALIAVGLGAFQAVNWALFNDDLPEDQAAASLGVANIATAGAGALTGIFGPVVDIMNATLPEGTYQVTFGLAAAVTALALLPLRRVGATGSP